MQNADLSRRRSRVRAPSSPPFLFNVFPTFSSICPDIARAGSRHRWTPTDTKCPQYSKQTVAATVALGKRGYPDKQISGPMPGQPPLERPLTSVELIHNCQCRNKTPALLPVLTTATTSPEERLACLFLLTSTENCCSTIEEVGEAEATAGEHRRGISDWTHRGR